MVLNNILVGCPCTIICVLKGHGSAAPPSGRSENDEEGKLFLSVTVLYCHDYLNFLVEKAFQVNWLKTKPFLASYNGYERHFLNFLDCWWSSLVLLCNSNQWQIQIPMSSLLAQKNRVRLVFMYFFHSIPKSVLIGGFSLGDWQFAPCIHVNEWQWFETDNLVRASWFLFMQLQN